MSEERRRGEGKEMKQQKDRLWGMREKIIFSPRNQINKDELESEERGIERRIQRVE